MLDKYTYATKFKLLIAGCCVMALIVYYCALQPTLRLLDTYHAQNDSIEALSLRQEQRFALLDPLSMKENTGTSDVSTREDLTGLLAMITGTNACEIVEIPVNEKNDKDTGSKAVNVFIVRGGFKDLVKSLDSFEAQKTRSFSVLSSRFYVNENPLLRSRELLLLLKTRIYEKES